MVMSRLRNIGLTLYYEIRDKFSLDIKKEQLETNDNQTYYFKNNPILETHPVYIYKNGSEITAGFTINYKENKVVFDSVNMDTDIIEADYSYCYVKMFLEYPDDIEQEIEIPSVCIQYNEGARHPLQLGSRTKKKNEHEYEVGIYANGSGQRDDISSLVIEKIEKEMPLVDYNLGFPINPDGTKNEKFNKSNQTIGWLDFNSISNETFRGVDNGEVSLYVMIVDFIVEDYVL